MEAVKLVSGLRKVELALFKPESIYLAARHASRGRELLRHSQELKLPVHFMPARLNGLDGASAEKLGKALLFEKYLGSKLTIGQRVELAADLANAIVKEFPNTLGYPYKVKNGQVEMRFIDHEAQAVYVRYVKPKPHGESVDSLLNDSYSLARLSQEIGHAFTSIHLAFSELTGRLSEHFGLGRQIRENVIELKTGT